MDIPPEPLLPDDLIAEILSYLNVKTLMQFRTVSKSWNSLISNPTFVNLHLQRSSQNPHVTIEWFHFHENFTYCSRLLSLFPVHPLLDNPPIIVRSATFSNILDLQKDCIATHRPGKEYNNIVVDSYNGLLCFYSRKVYGDSDDYSDRYSEYWLDFRNLAMGTISQRLGYFLVFETAYCASFEFSFGYDNSTGTYKVVAYRAFYEDPKLPSWTSEVKVFNLGDNSWRNIQSFPVVPLSFSYGDFDLTNAVHLIGTVNWLALSKTFRHSYDWKNIPHVENLVILSLSLSTETYTQLLLPNGFNELLHVCPTLRVLRNCLCFSHDFRGTEFVIWQMREFGVQESWTQLIKVSYETLRMKNLSMRDDMYGIQLMPLYLSEDNNTLIFATGKEKDDDEIQALIYNWKDDRVERTRFSEEVLWFHTIVYVESLVPTP